MNVFDHEFFLEQLETFSANAPRILHRGGLTAEAEEVQRVMKVSHSPFTLAVVGQMRVGKSSLINALVGEDLAITGVNETTATVNWFRHGNAEQAKKFHVVWEGSAGSEERDLSDIQRWVGDSDLAKRTRYLEFVSTAEFLKRVQIVDTPGTRSSLAAHEETLRGFLAERRNEQETLHYGGSADCVVYVLPPIARESDEELLATFASQTRLPGSSPYNSVAVLHKWETLDHPEPWVEVQRMARKMSEQLRAHVAEVLPVSGPLAKAVARLAPEFWNEVARLVAHTSTDTLGHLTSMERRFDTASSPGCPVDADGRRNLRTRSALPWPCFSTVLRLANCNSLGDGTALRSAVDQMSGVQRLLDFLDERFFSRSRIIRASTLLGKALRPCERARNRLRERLALLREHAVAAQEMIAELEPLGQRACRSRSFIAQTILNGEQESQNVEANLRALETEVRTVRESSDNFDRDLKAIRILDDEPSLLPEANRRELFALLGAYGCSVERRLAASHLGNEDLLVTATRRLMHWLAQQEHVFGSARRVLQQVVARLEGIADVLERGPDTSAKEN
jgi:hypothetical protein